MISDYEFEKDIFSLSLLDIERYLIEHHWEKFEHSNKKVVLFKGQRDDEGNQLEIVLPINRQYGDYIDRIYDALRLLSFEHEKDIKQLISEISLTSHDKFKVRLLETGPAGTIPLSVAANELSALKNLFVFAACSEEKSLPFFEKPLTVGLNYVDQCQFGHTFQGSFGFTINSPIITDYCQLTIFEGIEERPFERRVMERIIRSLNLIEKSVMEDNPTLLVDSFDVGLNSKMCESLLEVSQYKTTEVIFEVSWSSKILVPQDIDEEKVSWFLNRKAFDLIEYAAEELKKIEPYTEIVIGQIVTLHSNRNPMSEEVFSRQITVKYETDGKIINVKMDLERNGYGIALDAHRKGLPVKVKGKLFRKGNTWRMVDIEEISMSIV